MREFLLPGIVFFTSSLWGLYGRIPFTAIEPSRPFMDRAVGCAQLATAAYAIEQVYQNLTSTAVINYTDLPMSNIAARVIMPDLDTVCNITQKSPESAAATRTLLGHEAFIFPPNWTTQVTWTIPEPAPENDSLFENVTLLMLLALLALGLIQLFNYEVTDLVNKLNTLITQPPGWVYTVVFNAVHTSIGHAFHASIETFSNHLQRIEASSSQLRNQLFRLGQDLDLLREQWMAERNEIRAAQIDVQASIQNAARGSIQSAVHTSVQPAVQVCIQNAVQTCMRSAVQVVAAHTSGSASETNNETLTSIVDGLHDIQEAITSELRALSGAVGQCEEAWKDIADRLARPGENFPEGIAKAIAENLPDPIVKTFAEHLARSRSRPGMGMTTPSTANGGDNGGDNGVNQNEEIRETSHEENSDGDNHGGHDHNEVVQNEEAT